MSRNEVSETKEATKLVKMGDLSRVGKRLAYVLRYGALKEGLQLYPGGFVKLDELMMIDLMRHNNEAEVMEEVNTSFTVQGRARFESKVENGSVFIKASYMRNMEPPLTHQGTMVPRLMEVCMSHICSHIKMYDLEDFPDEYLLSRIYYRLKFQKRLTNAALNSVLGLVMESIDFNGVYVTENTLKLLCRRCPKLRSLEMKGCGYVMTDRLLDTLLKNLKHLVRLNLCECSGISDKGLRSIVKHNTKIEYLNISFLHLVTPSVLKELVPNCCSLREIHVQGNKSIDVTVLKDLHELADANKDRSRRLKIFADCNKHQNNGKRKQEQECKQEDENEET